MFRVVVVFALCTFFRLTSVAQTFRAEATESTLNNGQVHARITPGPGFKGAEEGRISVTRLREPPKAQELYNKALHRWRKGRFAEAQKILDKALKIYPRFPEALTLYGCLQISFQQWDSAEQKIQAAIQADPNFSPEYVRKYRQAATELNTFLHSDLAGDGSEQARKLLQKIQRASSQ